MVSSPSRTVRTYSVRNRPLSPTLQADYERLYPCKGIEFTGELIDPESLFMDVTGVIVEVGSGMGGATVRMAAENPGLGFIALEVFRPGVAKLLRKIESLGLANIRVCEHDAVEFIRDMIPEESLAGFHIFFPDPWPKRRHHKRRLIQPPFARLMAARLRPGGYVCTATDVEDYAEQILQVLEGTPGLKNAYTGFAPVIPWRPLTRFEKKGLRKSHPVRECLFYKKPHLSQDH
ncbi:MAG: tRNA (guanosine(46)-N7)-methyltransferase TrmB [Desulfobacteraceae bacterium]